MDRKTSRQMPAAKLEGAVLADSITANSSNQLMQVGSVNYQVPGTFENGPFLRVDSDEVVYIAAGDATIDATVANVGVSIVADSVEYFELEPGNYVSVTTTKA